MIILTKLLLLEFISVVLSQPDTITPDIQNLIVSSHNDYRRETGSSNMKEMVWNDEAAALAASHANGCVFGHNSPADRKTSQFSCGQNIARFGGNSGSWKECIDLWQGEIKNFAYGGAPTGDTGHYTQLVWAKSFQVGCSHKDCGSFQFYVCNYCPSGNLQGQESTPYKQGSSCRDCPNQCNNRLCTNYCFFTDDISNCKELQQSNQICTTNDNPDLKSKCAATCNGCES